MLSLEKLFQTVFSVSTSLFRFQIFYVHRTLTSKITTLGRSSTGHSFWRSPFSSKSWWEYASSTCTVVDQWLPGIAHRSVSLFQFWVLLQLEARPLSCQILSRPLLLLGDSCIHFGSGCTLSVENLAQTLNNNFTSVTDYICLFLLEITAKFVAVFVQVPPILGSIGESKVKLLTRVAIHKVALRYNTNALGGCSFTLSFEWMSQRGALHFETLVPLHCTGFLRHLYQKQERHLFLYVILSWERVMLVRSKELLFMRRIPWPMQTEWCSLSVVSIKLR